MPVDRGGGGGVQSYFGNALTHELLIDKGASLRQKWFLEIIRRSMVVKHEPHQRDETCYGEKSDMQELQFLANGFVSQLEFVSPVDR